MANTYMVYTILRFHSICYCSYMYMTVPYSFSLIIYNADLSYTNLITL